MRGALPRVVARLPLALARTIEISRAGVELASETIPGSFVYATGLGSGFRAAMLFSRLYLTLGGVGSAAVPLDQLPDWLPELRGRATMLVFSMTGEEEGLLEAVRVFRMKARSPAVLGVTGRPESLLGRVSDIPVLVSLSPPIVAYPVLALASALLAASSSPRGLAGRIEEDVSSLPEAVEDAISSSSGAVARVARELAPYRVGFVVGSGPNFPTALEVAENLSRAAAFYLGYSPAEFSLAPARLLGPDTPVILLERDPSVLDYARRYGAPTVSVGWEGSDIPIPQRGGREVSPVLISSVMAMLALRLAEERGVDLGSLEV